MLTTKPSTVLFATTICLAIMFLFLIIKASKEINNNDNTQLPNDTKENSSSEDSFIVGKLNQLLLTIKEITNQPRQNPQTPKDSPNIYKVKYLKPFTCINDNYLYS